MEKETNKVLAFLDVCIDNKDPSYLSTSVHRKGAFTGLFTNFLGFTSFSYKSGRIGTLVDRAYKINNSLAKYNDDVKKLHYIFKKNQYPEVPINRVIKLYFDKVHNSNNFTPPKDTSIIYFKLPFLNLSNFAQRKVRMIVKRNCKDLQIKLAFTSFKSKNLFMVPFINMFNRFMLLAN